MFTHAAAFNIDLSLWRVRKVRNMYRIFYGCTAMNQQLGGEWSKLKIDRMLNAAATQAFGKCPGSIVGRTLTPNGSIAH